MTDHTRPARLDGGPKALISQLPTEEAEQFIEEWPHFSKIEYYEPEWGKKKCIACV